MDAAEHTGVIGWCRHLFTGILFPGTADPDTRVRKLSLVLVLLLPAALLYPTRGFHLLEPDEGRYAQIPKEMLHSGSWVVPTLQGEAYLDKPPLMYWLTALSYRAFGATPEAARLVPALCVHLTILAVYLFGRRSVGERGALTLGQQLTFLNEWREIVEAARRRGNHADPVLRQRLVQAWVELEIMKYTALRSLSSLEDGTLTREQAADLMGQLLEGQLSELRALREQLPRATEMLR